MDWIDVSMPLRSGMVGWPGDPAVRVETVASIMQDGLMLSRLELGSHSGTHIDAPCHFIEGAAAVDAIAPWRLLGPCRVLDAAAARGHVGRVHLEPHAPRAGERILLKTRNGAMLRHGAFDAGYAALDRSGADYLAAIGVALVGIDALSIEAFEAPGHPVHKALLAKEIVILEGVDLSDVAPGIYDMVALPLRLEGRDGSPARVLLRPSRPASCAAASAPRDSSAL